MFPASMSIECKRRPNPRYFFRFDDEEEEDEEEEEDDEDDDEAPLRGSSYENIMYECFSKSQG